jgi:hypothetical protein
MADREVNPALPPPEPPDRNGTRPPLDLARMMWQVFGVQVFLRSERERAAEEKAAQKKEAS